MESRDPVTYSEQWRMVLTGADPTIPGRRRRYRLLPSDPRCKTCYTPFGGIGGWWMRRLGRRRWDKNPAFCTGCIESFATIGVGGAEIELSLLFADVRGSTGLAERISPAAYSSLMNRFYEVAVETLVDHDGIVDKFVGDEAVGLFVPGMTGPEHAKKAVDAARKLVRKSAELVHDGRPLPVGAGVHTGIAFAGLVGKFGAELEFTALGDAVNACARLASMAAAGEVLVSATAAGQAGLDTTGLEQRELALKGRMEPLDTFVLPA
jgi:adenylate cyclase